VRAIRFEAFGDPSVLKAVEVSAPIADEKTAVVRVMAASINPSDVKNVAGAMRQTTPPRIPGRDFAGVVEVGPSDWIGAEVWGTGGDTGFTRDGTHAALIAVPVASLRRKPKTLSFQEAASVGVNYVAAWCGIEAAGLKPGETVLLIGAGGGVGSAAAQIARRLGARVIGADRREPAQNAPIRAIAETLIVGAKDLPAEVAGDWGQGHGRCPRSGRRRDVPQRAHVPRLARQIGRNRRDRTARSKFRPRGFLPQRKPPLRRRHAQARSCGVRPDSGLADLGIPRRRLPRRVDRKDLQAR
jgi:threonine dehydrogenase-like Zn-dependent dehydrogenase